VRRRLPFALLAVAWVLSAVPDRVDAERLPFRVYTTADGLARDLVSRVVQDSRGFLWFCTAEGLSRFDGHAFTNFGDREGLPGPGVSDLIEARDGTVWIGTDDGLARLDTGAPTHDAYAASAAGADPGPWRGKDAEDRPGPLFRIYRPAAGEASNAIRRLLQARDGSILLATFAGLFRFDPRAVSFAPVDLDLPDLPAGMWQVNDLLEDDRGGLYVATRYAGLVYRRPDGSITHYFKVVPTPATALTALAADGHGGLWLGGGEGLRHMVPGPGGRLAMARLYTAADGMPDTPVRSLLRTADGRIVVGSTSGIGVLAPEDRAHDRFTSIGPPRGLAIIRAMALAEDRDGNLWIGSDGAGAFKLARDGFIGFTAADGLPGPFCASFLFDRRGRLYASTHANGSRTILNRLDGEPRPSITVHVPARLQGRGWGRQQLTFQDHLGIWWVPTGQGLVQFTGVEDAEGLAGATPSAVFTVRDGLTHDEIFRLFEDTHGTVWVSAYGLSRYDRAARRFVKEDANGPYSFGEDARGDLWLGRWSGDMDRWGEGRRDHFTARDGVPAGVIQTIYRDHRDRLWIGSTDGGVARVDDPAADRPIFRHYTTADGLSSTQVNCVVEDLFGRIYLGTARGLDVLDPETGHLRHFRTEDGLPASEVTLAARDASGALWFGTQSGLARLVPRAPAGLKPPDVYITEMAIAGVRQPIRLLGETAIGNLALDTDQRQVSLGFIGPAFAAGEHLRYQYRLEGSGADWSRPGEARSVEFAHLAPGHYRFEVRAIDGDDQTSTTPATVSFTIARPVWQRAWFVTLAAAWLCALAGLLYRWRVAQLLRVERVRTHIAADLHDDSGASLSRIAIQSDLARLPEAEGAPARAPLLADIGESARALVDSMSDIVWSIDPRTDDLASVIARVRQFALDLMEPRGIRLDFRTPPGAERLRLEPEQRRHLFLILKEAVNNIVRHSGCTAVAIVLRPEGDRLHVEVTDDGRGFVPGRTGPPGGTGPAGAPARGGHGVRNMRGRAAQAGGRLEIRSRPGGGTRLTLVMPLGRSGVRRLWRPRKRDRV
jgi:signal transduction histidine kinase/ligand-binding sensor domain-containing protein